MDEPGTPDSEVGPTHTRWEGSIVPGLPQPGGRVLTLTIPPHPSGGPELGGGRVHSAHTRGQAHVLLRQGAGPATEEEAGLRPEGQR